MHERVALVDEDGAERLAREVHSELVSRLPELSEDIRVFVVRADDGLRVA